MKRTQVESKDIKSIGYDDKTLSLEVEFNSGSIYVYFKVPKNIYIEFMEADSHGKFFHRNIKNKFEYKKLD
jgi:hypothetical protein